MHVGLVVAVEVDARAFAPSVRRDGGNEPGMAALAVAVMVVALTDVGVFDDLDAALSAAARARAAWQTATRSQWLFLEKMATTSSSVSTSSYSPMSATTSKSRFTASAGTSFVPRT